LNRWFYQSPPHPAISLFPLPCGGNCTPISLFQYTSHTICIVEEVGAFDLASGDDYILLCYCYNSVPALIISTPTKTSHLPPFQPHRLPEVM
jgi:hypothetical protein